MDKRYGPRSEARKRQISESIAGKKFGARDYVPSPSEMKDIEQLRKVVARGENLKYQDLIDSRGNSGV